MLFLCLTVYIFLSSANAAKREASVRLADDTRVFGNVRLVEDGSTVKITGQLSGIAKQGKHGFHVHELGDLADGCTSSKGHYNPMGVNHGDIKAQTRHIGDLGNVESNAQGTIDVDITLPSADLPLAGKYSVIGRTMVLHENPDDLGLGEGASLENGNAGPRIACGVIGYASDFTVAGSPALKATWLGFLLSAVVALI